MSSKIDLNEKHDVYIEHLASLTTRRRREPQGKCVCLALSLSLRLHLLFYSDGICSRKRSWLIVLIRWWAPSLTINRSDQWARPLMNSDISSTMVLIVFVIDDHCPLFTSIYNYGIEKTTIVNNYYWLKKKEKKKRRRETTLVASYRFWWWSFSYLSIEKLTGVSSLSHTSSFCLSIFVSSQILLNSIKLKSRRNWMTRWSFFNHCSSLTFVLFLCSFVVHLIPILFKNLIMSMNEEKEKRNICVTQDNSGHEDA